MKQDTDLPFDIHERINLIDEHLYVKEEILQMSDDELR